MSNLPTINAFWVGPRLGPLSAACLQSFARAGHKVILHVYERPTDVPKGIEMADASLLLSRDRVIRHRESNSLALASDIFRYELMAAELGLYVDCDCYCVRPLRDADLIIGRESDQYLGTAVLKIPPENPLLEAMRSIGVSRAFIPPWEKQRRQRRYRIRAKLGFPVALANLPWGAMGPIALTHYAESFGLTDQALPIDEIYPVIHQHSSLLRDPGIRLEDLITPRTKVVHLWNEVQRNFDAPPPAGSSLLKIMESIE
jgi:hypothetical protein